MTKICAITGSNGYVGGCVKKYFTARGWETFELTRRPTGKARGIRFQLGDDVSSNLLSGIDVFVHCAYDFKPLKWQEIRAVNVEGSRKVLEAARTAGIPKIIFISSISAFENCRSLYGKAKLEIEKIARDNGALTIRPGLVYGDDSGGMFGKLTEQVRKSSVIPMIGSGSQIQFLVHNEDLCGFIERYASGQVDASKLPESRRLTIAHEQPWPFKRLLLEIARRMDKKPTFVPLPWRFVCLGIKSAEVAGLRLNFRSDSLISLMYPNPAPDFAPNARAGVVCRSFARADGQVPSAKG